MGRTERTNICDIQVSPDTVILPFLQPETLLTHRGRLFYCVTEHGSCQVMSRWMRHSWRDPGHDQRDTVHKLREQTEVINVGFLWPFKAQWLLYLPSAIAVKNPTFCLYNVFMFFVWI